MKCNNCNFSLKDDDLFCPNCGLKVEFEKEGKKIEQENLEYTKNKKTEVDNTYKKKPNRVVVVILSIILLNVIVLAIYLIFIKEGDTNGVPIASNKETESIKTYDYPNKEHLKDGFYLNFETDFKELIHEVEIRSWYVKLIDDDTVEFTIKYQSEANYSVACMSKGANSFSTLYEDNGSSNEITEDGDEIIFNVPLSIYASHLTDGFNIIVTDSFNIGAGQTGSIHSIGSNTQSASVGYTQDEALTYFMGLNLIDLNVSECLVDSIQDDHYLLHVISKEKRATIGWYLINRNNLEVVDYMSEEVLVEGIN